VTAAASRARSSPRTSKRSGGVAEVLAGLGGADALERAPHVTTRAVVDVHGMEIVRELYAAFDRLNEAHFEGRLAPPLILVAHTSSPRALGDHCDRDVHGLRSRIRVHPKILERGLLFALDILLHEMVHTWQGEIAGDLEEGYRGHGPLFAGRCNAIGQSFGLPEVSPKGRHGKPDCAQWPLNVRPPGFYGDEAERVKRTTKRARASADDDDAGEIDPDAARGSRDRELAGVVCSRAADQAERDGLPRGLVTALRRSASYLLELEDDGDG
jgi:hypothetical protein